MHDRVRCEPESLAQHGCCEIMHCPHCYAIHLHIGPVSLRLPLEALRQVAAATAEAEVALRVDRPDLPATDPTHRSCKH